MNELLINIKRSILEHSILGGIAIVTLTFIVFMLTPPEAISAAKYGASVMFGCFIIIAGLMYADFS